MPDLIEIAKGLLESKEVSFIIGYTKDRFGRVKPYIAKSVEDANNLMFDHHSIHNLAVYLTRLKIPENGKVGIVAKSCDIKAIIALIQENQIKREQVYIIGMNCSGVVTHSTDEWKKENIQIKCKYCADKSPMLYDAVAGTAEPFEQPDDTQAVLMQKLEAMSSAERWDFWAKEFEKCIKCYACRQVCPMCYCEQCIAEKNQPQWITTSPTPAGNFSWNIIKAFHMAGRCVGCHECERACPMGIPLTLLTRKMGMVAGKEFNYRHGMAIDQPTLVGSYNFNDNEDFIK